MRNALASDGFGAITLITLGLITLGSIGAVIYFRAHGWLLYFGDAEAHLNIARRILDSRTPGYSQLGTVWLPLPHLLMMPFAQVDGLWRSGLAGSIPAAACFMAAAVMFYFALAKVFDSELAAGLGTALLVLNPNMLYLQAIPMTEPFFLFGLAATLYFTVRPNAYGAGIAVLAATLTRYEGWFLIPFVALYFWRARSFGDAVRFVALATIGPLWWLSYNWWYFGNPLEFYNGPYSALAIQGQHGYPGQHNWRDAVYYFFSCARAVLGTPLVWLGLGGLAFTLKGAPARKAWWPVLLLALAPAFYLLSMHSAGTPIFVPWLEPHGYYNTRYALAMLPLTAMGVVGLGKALAAWKSPWLALVPGLICIWPWLGVFSGGPSHENWITWKESERNSIARRAAIHQVANWLSNHLNREDTIFTTFNDLTGAYRLAGIPLRRTLTPDHGAHWTIASVRADLFLSEPWAVVWRGDSAQGAVDKSGRYVLRAVISSSDGHSESTPVMIYQLRKSRSHVPGQASPQELLSSEANGALASGSASTSAGESGKQP